MKKYIIPLSVALLPLQHCHAAQAGGSAGHEKFAIAAAILIGINSTTEEADDHICEKENNFTGHLPASSVPRVETVSEAREP